MKRTRGALRRRLAFCALPTGALAALALVAAACSADEGPSSTSPVVPATPAVPGQAADPLETPCLSTTPAFTARGTVSVLGGSRPDATRLSGIDWISTPECERIVFNYLTEQGAPASQIGLSRLEFAPEQGILRIAMPRDVDVTGIADVRVDGSFVDKAFVVRAHTGELSVDLHMRSEAPVEARGLIIGSPARLVIDLQAGPADDAYAISRPTVADDVVVLSPAPGEARYPLRIRGYARTVRDVVTAGVDGPGPDVDRRITAADSGDAWGEFAVTISEGPGGQIVVHVSTDRPAPDGGDGVQIPLTTS